MASEEVAVIFHAALLGRTDVISKAIANVKAHSKSTEEFIATISQKRPEDELTPLHVASEKGQADVVRALLVSSS